MSKRFWIVTASIAVHVVVFVVAFVTNAWRLDRLDAGKASISIAVLPPPPAPSGGPAPGVKPRDPAPVKKIVKEPTQPAAVHEDKPAKPADTDGGGAGTTKGPGTNPDGDPIDTGTCTGPACGPPTAPPQEEKPVVVVEKKQEVTTVAPPILKGLRYEGETAIAPSELVKQQMMRDDHKRSVGAFKICVSETGAVSSVSVVASTKYPEYDQKLMTAMRAWRYHPYLIGGQPAPVCSAVSFVYTME